MTLGPPDAVQPYTPLPIPADEAGRAALREWLTYLAEATHRIGGSLNLADTSYGLAEVVVPRLADLGVVYLLDALFTERGDRPVPELVVAPTAAVRRVAVRESVRPAALPYALAEGETILMRAASPIHRAMLTGEPVLLNRPGPGEPAEADPVRHIEWTLAGPTPWLPGYCALVVPLRVRGHTLGALFLMRNPDRPPFDDLDVRTAGLLAAQAGFGVDNADLYRAQAATADTLQHSMLPMTLPAFAGVELAYRYLPATPMIQVGGDWYDAIGLPGSRVAFVVGDVMGHGVRSAAIMGQFRTAVRTLAALDLPPDQVLRHLDDLAQGFDDGYVTTCLYVVYDPVARRVTVANAGHLPPLLTRTGTGEIRPLEVPDGPPIGVGDGVFATIETGVADDDVLVLFTDGLVESRTEDIDVGLARLHRDLAASAGLPLRARCDHLVGTLDTAHRNDDVAVLMARLRGIDAENVAQWLLQPRTTTPARVRRLVRSTLAGWDLPDLVDTAELLACELVTNAVRHATRPIEVRLLRTDALLCEVTDDDHRLPALRHATAMDEGGRGLHLVSRLARRWGASRTATGKVVWFECALR
ncbi:SpoIIE family protein phosphatase [Thermopolyspora sp. NPDC052614]|uniref:ATP-binding SpoIIE family protein phosphatase n=1 Tax=Thermopolyspora sp. NPDC052614 TaxID=3155682 RepID=UPI003428B9DD